MAQTVLDKRLPDAVKRLIDRLGVDHVFVVRSGLQFDPQRSRNHYTSEARHTVKASPLLQYDKRLIDGESILAGDARLIVAAKDLTFTPEPGQVVEIFSEGTEWSVVSADPIYSGELVAAYDLQVRRS